MTSNERLRAAITASGRPTSAVAERVGVDPKTVERWVAQGRTPHRSHRLALAQLLGEDDVFLWPQIGNSERTRTASQAEFVAIHPSRAAVSADTWCSLLDSATESVDLHAFAGSFLHDNVPEFDDRLSAAARRGVRVRLLFGDPDGDAARQRGEEEGIGDLLAARCRLTWSYLRPLIGVPGIEARKHDHTLYASVFRFDDTLFANPHTWGSAASHSPVLHLRRIAGGRLFDAYMRSVERVWDQAVLVS